MANGQDRDVIPDGGVTYTLSPKDYDRFVAAIDNPPPPSPALIKLLRRKPLWARPSSSPRR